MGSDDRNHRLRNDEYARLLFEEATDGLFVSSAAGVYLEVNRSGHRLLGYEDGELVGKHIRDVLNPRDEQRLRASLERIAAGQVQTDVWSMVCKDGSVVPCEVRAQRLSTGAVLGVVRSLDARAEFERKIRTSESKLWSILHTAPDIIMTVDRQGRILFINRTYPPFTMEQVVGASCYDFVPPESRPRVKQAIEHVFTTRQFDEYEVRTPPDTEGKFVWSAVRAGPQVEGERVVAAVLCATNVTEHKRESARTRELFARLEKIASLVPGVVYQCQQRPDGSACFPYASERIREIFRLSPEEVREDATELFAKVHPDDRAGLQASLRASAAKLEPWHHEFRVLFADGDERWLTGDSVPELQPDGSTLCHGFITDVTERKQAERSRSRLEEQLMQAQKMESVGQLAGGVAHDFNNLLTTIVAFVELAQDARDADSTEAHHAVERAVGEVLGATGERGLAGAPGDGRVTPDAVEECLEGIMAAANRGGALTQQLLAFARKKVVQPADVDLNAVLTRMTPMIRRLVGEHIEVELVPGPLPKVVRVDTGSMEQVIMNLIVNARDAMARGGKLILETAAIDLDASAVRTHDGLAPGPYVVLSVTDTGHGIAPEVRSRLFEPFFTTKPQGAGTGLGLAMCHGIVKQAGGTIAVDSELGSGTSFRIYLPRVATVPTRAAAASSRPTSLPTGNETVLVVEDEPMILRVAKAALERLGYQVLSASDGVEALEVAARTLGRIDLLVTDIVMPKLGGLELAVRLEKLRPEVKVLYTSGYAETAVGNQVVLREGVNFIQKPYALASLSRRVREVLDGH